jgi:hypothetical protein
MTIETMPCPSLVTEDDPEVKKLLVVGPGANADRLRIAQGGLSESVHHIVYYAGISTAVPAFEIAEGRLYEVDTDEGKEGLRRLIADKAFHATYYSTPAWLHEAGIIQGLRDVAEGRGNLLVATKPVVENPQQARRIRAAIAAAQARLRERLGASFNPEEKPLVLVHEHYLTKGPWQALRRQLAEVSSRLGRLESAEVHIQEFLTAKEEGREKVVGAGAFEDLAPHALSLGLDVQEVINNDPSGQYLITDNSKMDVDFVRHDDSGFPDGIETGFMIHGTTQVIDKTTADTHELNFVWCGGKGLIDKKEVRLTFVDQMGVRTTIVADLIANKLDIPSSLDDLFPETEFIDNGYGASVAAGLNGGNPRDNFQSYEAAEKVVLWGSKLTQKGRAKGDPTPYSGKKPIEAIF